MSKRNQERRFKFPHILPEINDWPINQLYQKRDTLVKDVTKLTIQNISKRSPSEVNELIAKTIYMERIRVKATAWRVDPPDEKAFWKKIRDQHTEKSLDKETPEAHATNLKLLEQIIHRYSEEITGNFKKKTFEFARTFLTELFNRLLNAAGSRWLKKFGKRLELHQRIRTEGKIDELRALSKDHTVILVPTHFSNLDSILIGYAIDLIGVPAFSYGAGLNLYNNGLVAYYMNRLGAYRVDRRKKNPIYLETLLTFSQHTIELGVDSLFFPGGTRSRTGGLDTKLKLGLLGTAISAQREHFRKETNKKIVVVPLILGYHFVLEARYLIREYLKSFGKEKYTPSNDKLKFGFRKTVQYIWKFFSEKSEIYLNFGDPMDVLGNKVDINGISYDAHGRVIDVKSYFVNNEKVTADTQRESEYTKMLADKIVESYHKDNVILSSHLVAFTAFNILLNQYPDLDLFGVLRLPVDEYFIKTEILAAAIDEVKEKLAILETNDKLILAEEIDLPAIEIIQVGLEKLGIYHALLPLLYNKEKSHIYSQAFDTLYYYHNRIIGYDLEKMVDWKKYKFSLR